MQVYTILQSYGVRPRLQALWRDAHGTAGPSDGPFPQSNKAKKRQRKAQQAEAELDLNAEEAAPDALAFKHMQCMTEAQADFVSLQQSAVFAICNSYKDLFLPNYPYPTRQYSGCMQYKSVPGMLAPTAASEDWNACHTECCN